jgi:hypothetical protein
MLKNKRIPSIFSDESNESFTCLRRHIYMSHIIFMRIGFTLLTCDMYMCRLRHINDLVLTSLMMEGIRLLLLTGIDACIDHTCNTARLT